MLDSDGGLGWAHDIYSDVGAGRVNQLAIDSLGSVIATGQSSSGGFVLKLDEAGAFTWVKTIDTPKPMALPSTRRTTSLRPAFFKERPTLIPDQTNKY